MGGALVRELLCHDYRIYAIGRKESQEKQLSDSQVNFVSLDMAEIKELPGVLPDQQYDILFHLAWTGSSGFARADTVLQLRNVQWAVDVLYAAKQINCKRVLCIGSITEHEAIAAAYAQGNKPGMGYIYGAGKVAAHIMCMSVAAQLGIDLIWPEITNAYGPGECSPRLVNTTIQKCICGEVPQFTTGTQNYDFVYIDDVARALYLIGERGKPFHEYLIGSSTARPLKEFLLEMQREIAPEVGFQFGSIPFTGIDLPLSKFNCTQTETDTGFRAKTSFAEGCRQTMKWWKKREGPK